MGQPEAVQPGELTSARPADDAAPRLDPVVRCRSCGHAITRPGAATEVLGAHEHTFRNPAGYSFHVLCFDEAPGCLTLGPATLAATWFPGYAWALAVCGGCHEHLGWSYGAFFGLIATRLLRPG